MSSQPKKTSPFIVILAWAVVAVPLGWGLYQSITKSKPLFTANGAVRTTSPTTLPAK